MPESDQGELIQLIQSCLFSDTSAPCTQVASLSDNLLVPSLDNPASASNK